MSLRRFLVPSALLEQGSQVTLPADEAAHALKVLRLREGDEMWLLDGQGRVARARVSQASKSGVACVVEEVLTLHRPAPRLVLCPGLLKAPAMDLLAVKAAELMADEIRPVICARSVPRLEDASRLERWRKLSRQALKQCGAPVAPVWHQPAPLARVLDQAPPEAARVMPHEEEQARTLALALPELNKAAEIWLLVGPEGGFTSEEARAARQVGWDLLGLGPTILRAETASIALLAVLRLGRA